MWWLLLVSCGVAGLGAPDSAAALPLAAIVPPVAGHVVLRGADVPGMGRVDVEVDEGRIVAVGQGAAGLPVLAVPGRWIVPGFIDSHVHLAYLPEGEAMVRGGVVGAVDLAAPVGFLAGLPRRPHVRAAGPMVAAIGGYPTRSWGSNGYGWEVADAAEATVAVGSIVDQGARVIKVSLGAGPDLDDDTLAAVIAEAHRRGVPVAAHALGDADAARAGRAGVDVLAHTPVGALSAGTVKLWSGRAVVSTVGAFGGTDTTVANLEALRRAGAKVLYGTDFGNRRTAGIDGAELHLLQAAGLDGTAILAAGTADPAAYWGFETLGTVAAGTEASFLLLDADPRHDPDTLTRPIQVWWQGRPVGGR
jgi:imidazolonepropionase-like amidohydrolase